MSNRQIFSDPRINWTMDDHHNALVRGWELYRCYGQTFITVFAPQSFAVDTTSFVDTVLRPAAEAGDVLSQRAIAVIMVGRLME